MNILVTGGCGYVGTVLTGQLMDLGHKVVFAYRPFLVPFLLSIGACVILLVWVGVRVLQAAILT